MIHPSARKKHVLQAAIATAVLAWTANVNAVDFSIDQNKFTICNVSGGGCTTSASGNVGSNGLVTRITDVPDTDGLGLATFTFGLLAEDATVGSYDFSVHVVISDDHSARKLEAYLPKLTLNVTADTNGDGFYGVGGHIDDNETLHFWGDTGGGYQVTGQLTNESANMEVLSNGSVTFDAGNILDKLASHPTFGSAWQNILDEFDGGGHYSYAIFVKRLSGPEAARFGTRSGTTFTPLPCATTSEIDNWFGPKASSSASTGGVTPPAAGTGSNAVYAVQGQFSTAGAAGSPGAAPTAFTGCPVTTPTDPGSGGGGTTTPPPVTDVDDHIDEVENILDEIDLIGEGVEITEAVINNVNSAAQAAAALGAQAAAAISNGTLPTNTALAVLNTISSVVDVAGTASDAASDAGQAGTTADNGAASLKGMADVLTALTNSEQGESLQPVQKEAIQAATIKAVVAGVKLIANATSTEVQNSVLDSLGQILSSTTTLGLEITQEQTDAVLEAVESVASESDDVNDALDKVVSMIPRPDVDADDVNSELASQNFSAPAQLVNHIVQQMQQFAALNAFSSPQAPQGLMPLIESVMNNMFDSLLNFIEQSFTLLFSIFQDTVGGQAAPLAKAGDDVREIPARAVSINIVPSTFPEGLRVLANGSVVMTENQVATIFVPASYDPTFFIADLDRLGTVTTDTDGGINITRNAFPVNFRFSGTFDYRGVISGGAPVERTALTAPASGDESDLNHIYVVTYRDGTQQNLQPFVAADGFVDSIRSRGLGITTNRNTGVVTVNGRQFRPSYFVDPVSIAARAFWQEKKDSHGFAFRPVDVNEDGVMDYEIITEDGMQVAYGITR